MKTWADAAKTTQATIVGRGDAVYVKTIAASTYIGGDQIVWQWTENGETQVRTNIYTILSLRMFADLNLDNTINSNDYAGASSLTSHGWVMPVASNAFRKVQLKNDVNFTGDRTLTLSGDANVRVWTTATPSTNDIPLLVVGQTVTNGIDGADFAGYPESMIYVEAIDSGTATLSYNYVGTGEHATGLECKASLSITAYSLDSVSLVAVPVSGLVVKKGDQIALQAAILPNEYVPPQGQPKWYYQQLKADGAWDSWTSFGNNATGTLYQHTTVIAGIFRVKATLTDNGHISEQIYLRTDDDLHSSLKQDDPDAFGVVDRIIQKTLRNTAKDELGSTYYSVAASLPLIRDPRILFDGVPKCNVFVADMCDFSGADVDPPIGVNNVYYSGPHSANQWAAMPDSGDPGAPYPIADWSVVPDAAPPQPGFVVASGREDGTSGHCGIVDYDGRWISAGLYDINRNAKFDDRSYWKNFISGLKTPPGKQVYDP